MARGTRAPEITDADEDQLNPLDLSESRPAKQRKLGHSGAADLYPRKRSTLACDVCRARRTKCDGQRPTCSFCETNGASCVYRPIAEPPPTKLELELGTIRNRLENIEGLLSKSSTKENEHHDRKGYMQTSISDDKTFPIMVIQNRLFMHLVGIEYDLADYLVQLERTHRQQKQETGLSGRMFVLQHHRALNALTTFYQMVHCWYPILPPTFTEQYIATIEGPLPPSSESCLVLMVAATGTLLDTNQASNIQSRRMDTNYSEAAFGMLSSVVTDFSITAVQSLILIALYFCCLLEPLPAYDYILMASLKMQNLIKNQPNDQVSSEQIRRSYWAILLIESELTIQIRLVESGIWMLDEEIPLPTIHSTWTKSPISSPAFPSPGSVAHSVYSASSTEQCEPYYLAEIVMRRMLHRCTTSIQIGQDGSPTYAPIVAAELIWQLDEWYHHLPTQLSFDRVNDSDQHTEFPLALFLRTQYYSCQASIYWPAAYQAIISGVAGSDLLTTCQKFFDSYIKYMMSIQVSVERCAPNAWTLYASVFIFTMAASTAAATPCLHGCMSVDLERCFGMANEVFDPISDRSPSLAFLQNLLKEKIHGSYRLSR